MKLEIENREMCGTAEALYLWLPDTLPFSFSSEGLLQVFDVRKSSIDFYSKLPEATEQYDLWEIAAVDGSGRVRTRLSIKKFLL
ncbi:MAG: hypothetical protein AAB897_02940 [Patescibacteria group bacterium]